ncbi:MAG: ribosome small subunit-dependent GTPase A [Solobacterium sp.]|nr:ribosome small subunit-dependent GTPase A [Solobacterium sp.]
MQGRIIRIVSKDYRIQLETGELVDAVLSGKLRLDKSPVAGDVVEVKATDTQYVVERIEPRLNELRRPHVANVDQALIVMSVKEPDFSCTLVDRLTFLIMHAGIQPVLIVTKTDLGISDEVEEMIQEYEKGPMRVIRTHKEQLDPSFAEIIAGKISVLTGQSGAGKSTLLNGLEPSFKLKTQEISKALGRGKHTTRHNELHQVAGGWVADTPGFSSLDFTHMKTDDLAQSVLEFQPYLNSCRFKDCIHQNEPDCAIKNAVKNGSIPERRYQNYLAILTMIQNRKEKYV